MFNRICPKCTNEIKYKSKNGYDNATKNNSKCRKCASEESGFIENFGTKGKNCGKDNPFYNKKHSEKTKKTISNKRTGTKHSNEAKNKLSIKNSGQKNPMYGKSFYDIWLKKYGKKEADHLLDIKKKKNSKAVSGKKNPMYNTPSPQGSGNGYKGWYKGVFFRSLREVCHMIYMDNNCINWRSGETISIPYHFHGQDRTYRPDFIINDSIIVEIKPKKLWNTPKIKAKTEAAKKYCNANNLSYELIDVKVNDKIIRDNIQYITFMGKYRKRFDDYNA